MTKYLRVFLHGRFIRIIGVILAILLLFLAFSSQAQEKKKKKPTNAVSQFLQGVKKVRAHAASALADSSNKGSKWVPMGLRNPKGTVAVVKKGGGEIHYVKKSKIGSKKSSAPSGQSFANLRKLMLKSSDRKMFLWALKNVKGVSLRLLNAGYKNKSLVEEFLQRAINRRLSVPQLQRLLQKKK